MKDIDFLPDWYTSGKRRAIACRTQYLALAGILAVMVVWNVVVGRSVTNAEARIAEMSLKHSQVDEASKEYEDLRQQIGELQKQASTVETVDSRVNVASVLAELSYLTDESVILKKVNLVAEKFAKVGRANNRGGGRSIVRAVRASGRASGSLPTGDVRFKILIGGIAAEGGDVMSLVSRLEDSEYFFHVELSYCRNSKVRPAGQSGGDKSGSTEVSEFEISCYLANYEEP